MLQVFLISANFSRLFLSAILYDLSAILQAERLAFRLYDALKIRMIINSGQKDVEVFCVALVTYKLTII